MNLGAFSISLAVKDLSKSIAFYEKLGFSIFAGDPKQHYVIIKNENTNIGLFEGMFQDNILTFNPGWDQNAQELEDFEDVRIIQSHLEEKGVSLDRKADPKSEGPASIVLVDPDGNPILIDQHR
jgi:catechol 2,3-dioxygenase-like lactoylglutathione lyase family enzyme